MLSENKQAVNLNEHSTINKLNKETIDNHLYRDKNFKEKPDTDDTDDEMSDDEIARCMGKWKAMDVSGKKSVDSLVAFMTSHTAIPINGRDDPILNKYRAIVIRKLERGDYD